MPETKTEIPPKVEPIPTPEEIAEVVPTAVKFETEVENKQPETAKKTGSETVQKPLFETIVINVPKVEPLKKKSPEAMLPETSAESETPKTGESVAQKKPSDENINVRPRIFQEVKPALQCRLTVSQESVSVINDGGKLSISVGTEGDADLQEINVTSSSPNDVEIALEPEMSSQPNQWFFIVKSISRKTGVFTATFESACGKKEIVVKVR